MVPECHFPPTVSQSPRQVEVPEGSGETGPQEGRHRLRALSSCACIKITREPAHKGNPRDGGLRPHGERPQEGPNPCRVCHVGELSGPRWASVSSWAKGDFLRLRRLHGNKIPSMGGRAGARPTGSAGRDACWWRSWERPVPGEPPPPPAHPRPRQSGGIWSRTAGRTSAEAAGALRQRRAGEREDVGR